MPVAGRPFSNTRTRQPSFRLDRSMSELISIVDDLKGRGIGLKVLTGAGAAINTTRPEGRLVLGVLTAFAEFERELSVNEQRRGCGPPGGAESVLPRTSRIRTVPRLTKR